MSAPEQERRYGLAGKRVVLGVAGGIAAYKAAALASALVQAGAVVDVVLTDGARHFIQPLTFQALTGRKVYSAVFDGWGDGSAGHVTLAREADVVAVAPATANTIARLAMGMTDDMLGAVALATTAPLVLAPAMEHHMWHHPATQANLDLLRARGAFVVAPETGRLASGAVGDGRLAAQDALLGGIRQAIGRAGDLRDRLLVVTAGGTQEPLDPVRFLGNRSTGQMGVAIAEAAIDRGARVILIAGPTVGALPAAAEHVRVETALEMQAAVEAAIRDADALVMAAAVADFRPQERAEQKIKKRPGQEEMALRLTRNPDILAGIDRPGLVKIGFAAETEDLLANAAKKLASKGLDLIVANDAVATIGSAASTATLLRRGAPPDALPAMPKTELAARIMTEIACLLPRRRGSHGTG